MILKKNMALFQLLLPAVACGLLLTVAFPKPHVWPAAFIALIPLLVAIDQKSARACFWTGFAAGCVHFITLIYWLVPTLNHYGGLHPVIAVLVLLLLCTYLALFPALFCLIAGRIRLSPWVSPLLTASAWTSLEYIRTYAFTGFSWGAIGYSQYSNLLFIQIADISGIYGISFVIVLVNAAAANLWTSRKNTLKHRMLPAGYALIVVLTVLAYGHQTLKSMDALISTAPRAAIGVVQGNIDQDVKWDAAFKTQTIEKYVQWSQTLSKEKPDLIIWPETALPFYYGLDKLLSLRVDQCIRLLNTHFLVGSPAFSSSGDKISYYNRAYMFSPDAAISGAYDKHHLVPFGEYVPFGRYLRFLGKIIAQAGDFSSGPASFHPLLFNDQKTGVLICFEILFPAIASRFVQNGATFLTTLTNDAWFGKTSAPLQHFSIAVFRAIENRRTLIRAANTGISGFIDPAGRILQVTDLFSNAAVSRELPSMTVSSFYTRHSDLFSWIVMVAFCLAVVIKSVKPSPRR